MSILEEVWQPQRVLITGGLGFQGLHLALGCLRAGHAVTVLNTPSARARGLILPALIAGIDSHQLVHVVLGSVTDRDTLEKIVPAHDVIYHLAAWASVDQSLERPGEPWEVNAEGTRAVLEAVRRFNPTARVVVASSCEVYGPARPGYRSTDYLPTLLTPGDPPSGLMPQNEATPLLPRSPYAASKVAADRLAYAYAVTYELDLVILRPSNVYGPWQRHGGFGAVIPSFVNRATYKQPLVVTGGGDQRREFLHVDDVVAAYLHVGLEADDPFHGDAYNVGSGETVSINELAQLVVDAFTQPGEPMPAIEHSDARVADVSGFLLDSTKAQQELGWAPTIKFRDGLARYIAWTQQVGKAAWK
jgi:dTDP-glucose 4,6-dehydratase